MWKDVLFDLLEIKKSLNRKKLLNKIMSTFFGSSDINVFNAFCHI